MSANPETHALLEQALRHVLAEQAKVLGHKYCDVLIGPAKELGGLAAKTWQLLSQGFHRIHSTDHLTTQAHAIEREIDSVSEKNWFSLQVSVSSIYERIQESFTLRPIQERLKLKTALAVRNHFHNIRLLLLEQLLGARMLINNSDYGSEVERVWQQFFQRGFWHLLPLRQAFRFSNRPVGYKNIAADLTQLKSPDLLIRLIPGQFGQFYQLQLNEFLTVAAMNNL